MFELWKTLAEFCHAPCCIAAGNFIIIYPPRHEARGILRERERQRESLLAWVAFAQVLTQAVFHPNASIRYMG